MSSAVKSVSSFHEKYLKTWKHRRELKSTGLANPLTTLGDEPAAANSQSFLFL
ncbi:hypothetical protein CY35_06G027400 [Sphagnum magellanicum]|nr:hypothetical protein CY35_06G027400 [Sphagnum magellanicum]